MKPSYPYIEYLFSKTPKPGALRPTTYLLILDLKTNKFYASTGHVVVAGAKSRNETFAHRDVWENPQTVLTRPQSNKSIFIFSTDSGIGVHGITADIIGKMKKSCSPKIHPGAIERVQALFNSYGTGSDELYGQYMDEGVRNSGELTGGRSQAKPKRATSEAAARKAIGARKQRQ